MLTMTKTMAGNVLSIPSESIWHIVRAFPNVAEEYVTSIRMITRGY